jgi:hypothetical protein
MTETGRTKLGGRHFRAKTLSLPAPGKGHDVTRLDDDFIAVADGATPLHGEPGSEVREYVEALLSALELHRSESASSMVRLAIKATDALARRHSPPISCTAAIARSRADKVEFVTLGDCVAVLEVGGRYETIRDRRLVEVDDTVVARLTAFLDADISPENALAMVAEDLDRNREAMNNGTATSYWSLSDKGQASRHVLHRLRPADEITAILLCTDGLVRLADTFHEYGDAAGLLREARTNGFEKMARRLRELEGQENSLRLFPRLSLQDDATAILLTPA